MIERCVGLLLRLIRTCACAITVGLSVLLGACSGGSSDGNAVQTSSRSVLPSTSTSSSSSSSSTPAAAVITLSGNISYDFVPHFTEKNGLDYASTQVLPGRGLVVELLGVDNQILSTSISDERGNYSFSVVRDERVRVRVKAQTVSDDNNPNEQWDFKVTDNTTNNRLYSMVGQLLAANESTAVRDLHASSGWFDGAYTQPRVAAPFAIIDSIFMGVKRLVAVDSNVQLPALELRWSTANNTANGDLTLGEIATSFYHREQNAIYILGSENDDIDEYDRHVILHEWGHYIEVELSRSDSIGGDHQGDDMLDMRVAMSEGFSNAWSAIMLNDPVYRDASGAGQQEGFHIVVNRSKNHVRGWYSEDSIQSILYNFYVNSRLASSRDIADFFSIITHPDYIHSDAFVTIYLFAEQLRSMFPEYANGFNQLLQDQNIALANRFGAGESNSGGYARHLPIYKTLSLNNDAVNVCSSNQLGFYNKTGVSQFLLLDVDVRGRYQITAKKTGVIQGDSNPDLYLYRHGLMLEYAEGSAADTEILTYALTEGTYLVEVVDARAKDDEYMGPVDACFDIRTLQLQ
jgi:hypothetical protein